MRQFTLTGNRGARYGLYDDGTTSFGGDVYIEVDESMSGKWYVARKINNPARWIDLARYLVVVHEKQIIFIVRTGITLTPKQTELLKLYRRNGCHLLNTNGKTLKAIATNNHEAVIEGKLLKLLTSRSY